MATIIFDFDDTLFDTTQLKQDVLRVATSEHFLKHDDVVEAYKEACRDSNYTFENHAFCLKKKYPELKIEGFLQDLHNLLNSDYVFEGVETALKELDQEHKLILLTKGERDFQLIKLEKSGLKEIFNNQNLHIVNDNKAEYLKNLSIAGEEIYFLNDKDNENKAVKELFPHFNVISVSQDNSVLKIIKKI